MSGAGTGGGEPLEIERKFIIRRVDESVLDALAAERWEITQTYLRRSEDGVSRRVRRVLCAGEVTYYYNEKIKLSGTTRIERERVIGREEYEALLYGADPALRVIEKTRWRIPHGELLLEIDHFPFWQHQAYCEIELPDEDASFTLPDWVRVVREVTDEKGYTNLALAKRIPDEDIID